MNPIKLYRDAEPDEKKEDKPGDISKSINDGLDKVYNTAIDHAIGIVQIYNTGKELSPLVTTIISGIEKLKKKV